MRSKLKRALRLILAILVLASGCFALWIFSTEFYGVVRAANPSVAAAIIGAMATALVGIGGVLLTQAQTRKREIAEAHRPRKVEIYQHFLEMTSRMMTRDNKAVTQRAPSEKELADFFVKYKTNVILWASPQVIKAQLRFESASSDGENVLFAADRLYLAIREDLGLSNRGLSDRQLIKMYLKDPKELDAQ
jgi:hypothetical protein